MRHSDAVDRVGMLRTERGKAAACFSCGNPQLLDQLRNVRFIRAKLRKIDRHADAADYAVLPDALLDGVREYTAVMDAGSDAEGDFFTFATGQDRDKYAFFKIAKDHFRFQTTTDTWRGESGLRFDDLDGTQWHRYVFAVSGGSAKLYIDGAFAAETTDLTTGPADMGSRLKTYLGKSFYEEEAGFQGALDNVAVYKQALNESEIMQLFGSQRVRGDVSADGKYDIADAVFLQKYLLTLESALPDRQAGDMDENGRLNACDLTLLKRLLMK